MALDGLYLYCLLDELKRELLGYRVEKIHQPGKLEIVLSFRSRTTSKKLLLSASGNAPRLHLTQIKSDNPNTPPMLTMLLRKNLSGAVLTDIRQQRTDRVAFLDFDATNEIGDHVKRTLVIEIMAQYSNIILLDENQKILDSVKRVDLLHSSVRQILPGLIYTLPPAQGKPSLLYDDIRTICDFVDLTGANPAKALLFAAEGMSPVLCREMIYRTAGNLQTSVLYAQLEQLRQVVLSGNIAPCSVMDTDGKPVDFSFISLTQYQGFHMQHFSSLSEQLDAYYAERERIERAKSTAADLFRSVNTLIERTSRKVSGQTAELAQAAQREEKRVCGDLIQANLYQLEKGALYYDLENFYDDMKRMRIAADPRLTPSQNAQKYYREYRKLATAEKYLTEQIAIGQADLDYLQSVRDALSRAEGEREFSAIRGELISAGFLKKKNGNNAKKKTPSLPYHEYVSPGGFRVLAGRNNIQNDALTFRLAGKNDIWFHVQKFHGSHVILLTEGQEPDDADYLFAAEIAVAHSEVKDEKRIPVDYTRVKNIKKPSGAKPGFVIYHVYYTMIV